MRVKRPIMLSWVMLSAGMSGWNVRHGDMFPQYTRPLTAIIIFQICHAPRIPRLQILYLTTIRARISTASIVPIVAISSKSHTIRAHTLRKRCNPLRKLRRIFDQVSSGVTLFESVAVIKVENFVAGIDESAVVKDLRLRFQD
jgi:hypothetical protein